MEWAADFETTTNPADCRVWAWCACPVGKPEETVTGNTLDSFMEFTAENPGTFWFHNLAFDGEFILHWLMTHGYEYSDKPRTGTYSTLISGMGKFYQIKATYEKKPRKKVKQAVFKDSLKKLPMPVAAVAKAFKLPISKLEIDYTAYRAPGHLLTPEEDAYIKNDVRIVSMALDHQFREGLTNLTMGSDALHWYKDLIGPAWKSYFPVLDIALDADIRKAYKGGYTYVNPRFQSNGDNESMELGWGSVYDVNSLYPSVMYFRPLPVGNPVPFAGKYRGDGPDARRYPLYIQRLTCTFRLRPDHLPTVQLKNNPRFHETEYLTECTEPVQLHMTNVDLGIFLEHYDVEVRTWDGGYMFRQEKGLFKSYIDHWMHIKETTTGGMRQLAKLMLNSLYGKFATNPDVTPKLAYLKPDGSVGYRMGDHEERDPVYTPLGCFVTAWARYKTITSAQAVFDRFMYADTDSLHVLGCEPVKGIEVHPTKLGMWKHESDFCKAKYLRAKTYMERIVRVGETVDGVYKMVPVPIHDDVKCAGMPQDLKKYVSFASFKKGFTVNGKLRPVHVPGGIVLKPGPFTIL